MAHSATPLQPSPSPSPLPPPSPGFKRAAPDSREEPVHAVSGRPWSSEELTILFDNQQLGRAGRWKALSECLLGRSADACRSKYKNLFSASCLKGEHVVSAPTAPSPSVAYTPAAAPSQPSPEHQASHIMRDERIAADALASVPAPVRSPVDSDPDVLPRTERSHVLATSELISVNGGQSSATRQMQSAKEQIGELYIQVVTVQRQQESRRSQMQSMEAEIARLRQQLESQRQELTGADERVRQLRTQMDVLADQVTRGKS